MNKPTAKQMQRRTFLNRLANILGLGVLASVVYPLFSFLGFHLPKEPVKLKIHKTLLPGGFLIQKDFVLFNHPVTPWAVSRKCTHLGCHLNLNENAKLLVCPCHQSTFDLHGIYISGPARRNLPAFQVESFKEGEVGGFIVTM